MLTGLEGPAPTRSWHKTDASREVQAYHNLAKQFHPDRFQSSEFSADVQARPVLSAINESYATLKDLDRAPSTMKRPGRESAETRAAAPRAGTHGGRAVREGAIAWLAEILKSGGASEGQRLAMSDKVTITAIWVLPGRAAEA
jgi:DnaJ-class molecular chaperone